MNASSQRRTAAARRVGLALLAAGALAATGQADAASTHSSKHKSSTAPDTVTLRPGLEYPNPEYPNHKPLRGNYPGSYPPSNAVGRPPPAPGFDWLAAGAGAAAMLGLILLFAAARSATRSARNRRHRIPFVVDVRDDTPTTG